MQPKPVMQPYLLAELRKEPLPSRPERVAEVIAVLLQEPYGIEEFNVSLTQGKIISTNRPAADQHPMMDVEEMTLYEDLLLKDPLFKQELKKMNLPNNTVIVADPWIYGADDPNPKKRMVHFLCYMRNPNNPEDPNSNHYAWPLPIVPVMETDTRKIIRVDWALTGDEKDGMNQTYNKEDTMEHVKGCEYEPHLRNEHVRPIKPLHISQPEGPSFTVTGHLVEWQDWRFRIGFNFREGLTIHDVSFKGHQLFYRLSFSDSPSCVLHVI